MRERLKGQRGASSVEFVLYTPLLFMIIFMIVQFALTWHGNQVASAVARETAREARVDASGAGLNQAEAHGYAVAEAIGEKGLENVTITVELVDDDEVRVTVRGRSMEIITGLSPTVEQTVHGPVEEFKPDL